MTSLSREPFLSRYKESPCQAVEIDWDQNLKYIEHAAITLSGKPILLLGPSDIDSNFERGRALVAHDVFRAFIEQEYSVDDLKVEVVSGLDIVSPPARCHLVEVKPEMKEYFIDDDLFFLVCAKNLQKLAPLSCMMEGIVNIFT